MEGERHFVISKRISKSLFSFYGVFYNHKTKPNQLTLGI